VRIAIIGTAIYKKQMQDYARRLEGEGHYVTLPAFDDHPELDELGVCEFNRKMIEGADEVHMFWNQRSVGTLFDFGMVFALRKKLKIIYLEPKTFIGVMKKYCERFNDEG